MIASLIALVVSLLQPAAPPAGTIRGHVFDRDTGRPLLRAVVRLHQSNGSAEERIATTDEGGAFAISGLPPGRYNGVVVARDHDLQVLRTDAIALGRDDIVDVVVRVEPTFGIDVRVVDPSGEPLSGIEVHVVSSETGQVRSTPMMHGTDDLGHMRAFGLLPGRYVICADPQWSPFSGGGRRSEQLRRTCYPSNDESSAELVRLDRANVGGIEIRMRRGRTFTIAGTILDASGAPASAAYAELTQIIENGGSSSRLEIDASAGRFRFANVPPGNYAIRASILDADRPTERAGQAGLVSVPITDADVDDLVVSMKKTVDVQGRFVADDGVSVLPSSPNSRFAVEATVAGTRSRNPGGFAYAMTRADQTFTLPGLFGLRELAFGNIPRGWYVKAIRYGDRDIIDTPTEFTGGRDAPVLEVVLSNRGAGVNGTVTADDGTAAKDATVYLLRLGSPRGVLIAGAAPVTAAGAFRIGPVRGGEYALVALPSTPEVPPFASQDRLTRLAALGERITLTELDERRAQIHVVRER